MKEVWAGIVFLSLQLKNGLLMSKLKKFASEAERTGLILVAIPFVCLLFIALALYAIWSNNKTFWQGSPSAPESKKEPELDHDFDDPNVISLEARRRKVHNKR